VQPGIGIALFQQRDQGRDGGLETRRTELVEQLKRLEAKRALRALQEIDKGGQGRFRLAHFVQQLGGLNTHAGIFIFQRFEQRGGFLGLCTWANRSIVSRSAARLDLAPPSRGTTA